MINNNSISPFGSLDSYQPSTTNSAKGTPVVGKKSAGQNIKEIFSLQPKKRNRVHVDTLTQPFDKPTSIDEASVN